MQPFVFLILALLLSLAIIPVMIRYAPALGLIDEPDPRKVHSRPVARVGGVGIVVGTLVAILVALPLNQLIQAYVAGALVLLIFGLADDRMELGHYVKFIGQFIAAGIVVFWGDLYVTRVPEFLGGVIPPTFGIPLTIFAVVGVINAINHSDGLDGLAGGESLLSLLAIFVLSYLADGPQATLIAAASIGGVLGFLRYNTHPAIVFMGDSGSQFLGFTLGFLAVLLTQQVNTAVSAALPLLLIGLPIVDILVVLGLRIQAGGSWFKATRNHIHHRLLDLRFVHAESVVAIYSVQAFFVVSAVALCYHDDWLITLLYLLVCAVVFLFLVHAERAGWKADSEKNFLRHSQSIKRFFWRESVKRAPGRILAALFLIYLIYAATLTKEIPNWTLWIAASLMVVQLLVEFLLRRQQSTIGRLAAYTTVGMIAYLMSSGGAGFAAVNTLLVAAMALFIGIGLRLSSEEGFKGTPFDYLVVLLLMGLTMFSQDLSIDSVLAGSIITGVVLLYGCEYLLNIGGRYAGLARYLPVASLVAIGFQGIV
jgi:UDP-GlcNAc:undecaprenyl-phosphate GlcNAc-1-phosphate transferase